MSGHTKWEIMPYTRRDSDNIRWVKEVRGKRRVAICQTFPPNAEANARLIAAAPETTQQRDDLLAACGIVLYRLQSVCLSGKTMQDFLDAGAMGEIVGVITEVQKSSTSVAPKVSEGSKCK